MATELDEARVDIEEHEDNAEKRAQGLSKLLVQALDQIRGNAEILAKILQAEQAKRKLADETLPKMVNGKGGKGTDESFFQKLFHRDMVEVIILIGIGGAIYAVSPDFFRLIIGLLSGNPDPGGGQ